MLTDTIHIRPGKLGGQLSVPPSKSQTLRAILFGSLAKGQSIIHSPLCSPDAAAMANACRALGASLSFCQNRITIQGAEDVNAGFDGVLNAGNSGIVLRFIGAIAGLSKNTTCITGDRSIRTQRDVSALLHGLNQLGATTYSENGYAPLMIQGPMSGQKAKVNGLDSQPISGLLIALSLLPQMSELQVEEPGETPWIEVTLDWLNRMGVKVNNENYTRYQIYGVERFPAFEYHVPGDWSSAAFPLVAAFITRSSITIDKLENDTQGDKKILKIIQAMGGDIRFNKQLEIHGQCALKGIEIDANECIDAIPALAVLATAAEGTTRIFNAAVAKTKECDRLTCLERELKKMGANITSDPDGLTIEGGPLKGAAVSSHGDHRMAMALAIAGLSAEGSTEVAGTRCIQKSFPTFLETFQSLGAKVHGK